MKKSGLKDISCPQCGKIFHPTHSNTIYCSRKCYLEEHNRKPKKCVYCGKTFAQRRSGQIYCSRACQWASLRKLSDIECAECGKKFRPKNRYVKYCSRDCQYKAKSKGNKVRREGLTEDEKRRQIAPLFDYNNLKDISKINLEYKEFLESKGYIVELEKELGWGAYDLCVGNTLIDINPFAYHNITRHPYDKPRDKMYHYEKLRLAVDNGYRCIMVWDRDKKEDILNLLDENKIKIGARECEVIELDYDECHDFFELNHIQGDTRKDKNNIYVGLMYKGNLIQAMSFGKPRQNKNYKREVLRLCTLRGYSVNGGASKIFKFFLDTTNADSIISYCDMSKFSGEVYKQLQFKLLKRNRPSKHWYNPKTKQHITDGLIRKYGYDRLFKTKYGKGVSNDELMKQAGYVEIYDCGQATYIYEAKKL